VVIVFLAGLNDARGCVPAGGRLCVKLLVKRHKLFD